MSIAYSKKCNIGDPIGEILIPENEPCDIWCNWENAVRDFILKSLQKDICFLDIGANIGYFSLWAATKAKMVVSIEPNPVLYELLNYNCIGSGKFSNIKTYNIAISDKTGYKEFYYRIDAAGDGRLYNPTECGDGNKWLSRSTPTDTLSSLQDKYLNRMEGMEVEEVEGMKEVGGAKGVGIIKIDCEGSEYDILRDLDFFKRKENRNCEIILELHETQIKSRCLDYEGFIKYLKTNFEMSYLTGVRIRNGDILGDKYVVLKLR